MRTSPWTSASLCAVLTLTACLPGGGAEVGPVASARQARAAPACTARLHAREPRPEVRVACRFLSLVPARYPAGRSFLRHLLREAGPREVADEAIRATAEFRSYMDPENVWQWGEAVTEAEALAACRAMLVDLHAGRAVRWEVAARAYLARVRARIGAARAGTAAGGTAPDARQRLPAPRRPGSRGQESSPDLPARDVRAVLDDIRTTLPGLRGTGDPDDGRLADELGLLLDRADERIAAVTVLLAGTTVVITGVVIAGQGYRLILETGGALALESGLATRMARPLLQDLGRTLHRLDEMSGQARSRLPGQPGRLVSHLSADERIAYRQLIHRPVEGLTRSELERIDAYRRQLGPTDPLHPGTATHKADRWARYRGTQRFARWSRTYDQNMLRPRQAHEVADRVWKEAGWGEREVPVWTRDGEMRVHDVADRDGFRAIEVKSGYVSARARIVDQARKDAKLVADNWTIRWHVEGRCSGTLRALLRAGGIELFETHPNTPIKDLPR